MESIVSKCIEQLLDLMDHVENVRIEERVLLNPHHGVKQCFHTMDVAVYDWATSEMVPAGPTSEKSASLMKNRVILVDKHCKKKEKEMRRRGLPFFFFPPPWLVFFFITPWTLKQQAQRQKKSELSREDHVSSKVGFLKFCYLLFLANNYETVILNIETIFCKIVLLPLLVELELELETKSPFGAEIETNI